MQNHKKTQLKGFRAPPLRCFRPRLSPYLSFDDAHEHAGR